jgi:hypothetical protein
VPHCYLADDADFADKFAEVKSLVCAPFYACSKSLIYKLITKLVSYKLDHKYATCKIVFLRTVSTSIYFLDSSDDFYIISQKIQNR